MMNLYKTSSIFVFFSLFITPLSHSTDTPRQKPSEPKHVTYNVKFEAHNNGHLTKTEGDCLCTFLFGQQMKDCVLQLSDDQLTQELKTYKDNRLRYMWDMLNLKQKRDVLTASDDALYLRIHSIDINIPHSKDEFTSAIKRQAVSSWSAGIVAGVLTLGTWYVFKSQAL